MNTSIIGKTDSYKVCHWMMYPEGVRKVYSYWESRGGNFLSVVFFGLQGLIREHLLTPITQEDIDMRVDYFAKHFGSDKLFNKAGWEYILNEHGGKLPVSIKAVPEGMVVPAHNIMMSVENTDDKVPWLTNYLETLLCQLWYPCTVATLSREIKKVIMESLVRSSCTPAAQVLFKLHDFGFRGVSSCESAAIGGAAHLINFYGTDTLIAIDYLMEHYGSEVCAFSVPASEHSVACAFTKEHEPLYIQHMINKFSKMEGLVAYSVVGDTWDIRNFCHLIAAEGVKKQILEEGTATFVVRPDSGDPRQIVHDVFEILLDEFGHETNAKGFKVLPSGIRVIQGDGVNFYSIIEILNVMIEAKVSTENLVLGCGGKLLQASTRDTQRFAFKASDLTMAPEGELEAYHLPISKDPVTDHGKKSKRGRLRLIENANGRLRTIQQGPGSQFPDQLIEVYRDGELLVNHTLDEVRERVKVTASDGTCI